MAHKIDAFIKANGGLLRYEDMAAFSCNWKSPSPPRTTATRSTRHGFWSQGPAMMETLNILEGFEVSRR